MNGWASARATRARCRRSAKGGSSWPSPGSRTSPASTSTASPPPRATTPRSAWLENLDTDLPPPEAALIEATRDAVGAPGANNWPPFTGRDDLKEAVAAYVDRRGGPRYDAAREIVITSGEGDAMLDALFCLTDPGDEVIVTDPTHTRAC